MCTFTPELAQLRGSVCEPKSGAEQVSLLVNGDETYSPDESLSSFISVPGEYHNLIWQGLSRLLNLVTHVSTSV